MGSTLAEKFSYRCRLGQFSRAYRCLVAAGILAAIFSLAV